MVLTNIFSKERNEKTDTEFILPYTCMFGTVKPTQKFELCRRIC